MALRFCSRIDRRGAILGMLAAGGVASLVAEAPAAPAPDAGKVYVAFFLGQGGYLFSWGIPVLESEARKLGLVTQVFSYSDVEPAWRSILARRNAGYKIALVGYSLGNTTATYLQRHLAVDLLLAISESSLGRNHPIRKENTKRAVLWYGNDILSNAGLNDGFDQAHYIGSTHLLMDLDPRVVKGVLDELKVLVAPERRDETVVAANARPPKPAVSPGDGKSAADKAAVAEAPVQQLSAGWLPPTHVITPDVTCTQCWGFEQSLGGAGTAPWTR